ncbi:GNAT family N-acetyltransferase [Variovorax sp. J22P168]|uniref:GNAT family N-acetyltransferase n=1 Tax=Variovorax jilinensis TaxID=3053513 RepID=UPI002575A235|nr:GNAT family N-acetyltransferase [Variovorax sp. J22P168]MDM0015380.1 GNAT family N-acetyltransferase [Variovorax sp. J22P168]
MNAAEYLALESLRDGRPVRIRALKPADRDAMLAAVGRTGDSSLYRRFFSPKHGFTEREIAYYMEVDFVGHVALAAELDEGGAPVIAGGGRYIVGEPGCAEMAFVVDDPHQGLGIGKLLMRHLALIAKASGIDTLSAEVLADNAPMLAVFKTSGLPLRLARDGGITLVHMDCRHAADTAGDDDPSSKPGAH